MWLGRKCQGWNFEGRKANLQVRKGRAHPGGLRASLTRTLVPALSPGKGLKCATGRLGAAPTLWQTLGCEALRDEYVWGSGSGLKPGQVGFVALPCELA